MQTTCSNMFQNDNVTNGLIYGVVNYHGFEDTAIPRIIGCLVGAVLTHSPITAATRVRYRRRHVR